jgi:hypothetical protein
MTVNRGSLQDELLADLRVAAPIPVSRPDAGRPAVEATPVEETPTVALRLTPWRWARPSVRRRGGEQRLELTAGPLRISLTGFDR